MELCCDDVEANGMETGMETGIATSKKKHTILQGIIVLFLMGLCLLYGVWTASPTSKPGTKVAGYDKTMTYLNSIATKPHASGSSAVREVKQYLTDQLDQMGAPYETDDFTLSKEEISELQERFGEMDSRLQRLPLSNILVKLDASDTEEGVMFVSHYDSVEAGPGASDDGISVASMLSVIEETIKRNELSNDMYFLFTDGEEIGLLGATHFAHQYSDEYQDKIKLVINLEARGTRGPLLMFETSNNDYEIAQMLKKAVKSGSTPVSLAVSLYKTMPNDTDLSVFLDYGYQGMNFAVVNGGENYHTEFDTAEELDTDTAYMYYTTASELADYLEESDLESLKSEKTGTYFPIAKGKFLLLHETVMNVISVISVILFLTVLVILIVKKRISGKKILLSAGALIGMLAITAGITFLFDKIEASILHNMGETTTLNARMVVSVRQAFIIPWLCCIVLAIMVLQTVLKKRLGTLTEHLCVYGGLFAIATGILFFVLRGVTYLVSSVLLIIALILLLTLFLEKQKAVLAETIGSVVLTFISAIVFIPIIIVVYQALFLGEAGYDLVIFTVLLVNLCAGALLRTTIELSCTIRKHNL